jgi:hypothetical protein
VGATDASSGGGAGAGIPGGGTDMRTGGSIKPGNVEKDRAKLFPEQPPKQQRDDSDFGGPLKLDDPSVKPKQD